MQECKNVGMKKAIMQDRNNTRMQESRNAIMQYCINARMAEITKKMGEMRPPPNIYYGLHIQNFF